MIVYGTLYKPTQCLIKQKRIQILSDSAFNTHRCSIKEIKTNTTLYLNRTLILLCYYLCLIHKTVRCIDFKETYHIN